MREKIASLKEALNLSLKYSPSIPSSVTREKNKVVIEIQEGWEWREAIGLYHMDLSPYHHHAKEFQCADNVRF
ncbi:hypothetical protein LA342_08790 [Campylobacter upsaliensis]|uniref:hypothetical protein n=1 Tax=Campylobacter upsaliensis TaxID=28080 RepID=UPI001CE0FF9D|nr:hypothetical protein [Campylobacter upsaliensis]MCA5589854.1 hypothetical protein [Campylobacter upsaliensis]